MTDTDKPAKNPPGRPPSPTGRNGRKISVYLGKAALDAAARIGDGNVSAGIRMALARTDPSAVRIRETEKTAAQFAEVHAQFAAARDAEYAEAVIARQKRAAAAVIAMADARRLAAHKSSAMADAALERIVEDGS